jgi:GntR family transcriptional repressor for pyruvate dehydrogenase complex
MKIDSSLKSEISEIHKGVISEVRDLIKSKNLEFGDKLPSERSLSEKFHVSRSTLRESLQILEFFGIVHSKPQSGTFIADIGPVAIEGMFEDILGLGDPDFKSLVETRILLELKTVRLASKRRSEEDIERMRNALDAYKVKVLNGEEALEEDLLFHLAIARASGNSTMNTFMLTIAPGIVTNFAKYHVCDSSLSLKGIKEHEDIFEAILNKDADEAELRMKAHFKVLYQFCYSE